MDKGIDGGAYTMIRGFNREFSAAPRDNSMSGHPVEFSPAELTGQYQ